MMSIQKTIECKLHSKIVRGEQLTEEDFKILSDVVKEVLTFMAKEKIIPSPQNYERWFKIFCYAKENDLNLSKTELIDLYFDTYGVQVHENVDISLGFLDKVAQELYNDVQQILANITEHDKNITKGGEQLQEMAATVSSKDIQYILENIITEVKGLKDINRKFIEKLEEQSKEIKKLREELGKVREEANVDPLTGLKNRRSFERTLQEFFRDYHKFGYPFSIIMMDLDNFKNINDEHGHPAGDAVLREMGKILRNYLRAKDIPARTGGEEFTIILPGINKEEATAVADRLRRVIENYTVEYEGKKINPTASFGIAEVKKDTTDLESLIREADNNLYEAKRTGKNRVVG